MKKKIFFFWMERPKPQHITTEITISFSKIYILCCKCYSSNLWIFSYFANYWDFVTHGDGIKKQGVVLIVKGMADCDIS